MHGRQLLRDRWIRMVLAHHRLILVLAIVLTALSAMLASRLQVDSDLRRLLPDDHPVLRSLETIEKTFGSTGTVNVVIKGENVEGRHALADAVVAKLEGHALLRDVDDRLPSDFFVEHALYYLTDGEMRELEDKVQAYTHFELCSRAPDMCTLEPDPKAEGELEAFVEGKRDEAQRRTGFRDRYEREGVAATVVILHPTEPAASLDFAKRVSDEMRGEVAAVYAGDGAWNGTDVHYNIVGAYTTKADEQATIKRDVLRGGLVGFAGVVGILYLLFRSARACLVLVVPLACGVTWSLAATWLMLGRLNLMTSLISTVLMGMGIDAGIHFFVRAKRDRRKHDDAEAIRRAFHSLIVPLFVATGTTAGAFLVMSTSDFPAFREFGLISAVGMALCMLAMTTVLPALVSLVGIKRHDEPPAKPPGRLVKPLLTHGGALFAAIVAFTVLSFEGARHLQFEYNGRALQSDRARYVSEPDVKLVSQIFGKDIHAGILVRPDLASTRKAAEQARARHEARKLAGDSVVADLFAVTDLLPDPVIDLRAREKEIERLREDNLETFEKLEAIAEGREHRPKPPADDWDDDGTGEPNEAGEAAKPPAQPPPAQQEAAAQPDAPAEPDPKGRISREEAQQLVRMFAADPFGVDDLPAVLLRRVRASDGSYGVFAYPDFDAADMRKGVEFTKETSQYVDGDDVMFVGETTVYASMFLMLREEAPVVIGMASVLIVALVYWQLRAVGLTLLTLVPLGLALWWLVGAMGTIDLKFTLFNMPIVPAILGIGVDNGVYLTDTIRQARGEVDNIAHGLQETGGAILAATFTTVAGFAAFMVADSAGLRGIGALAAAGITLAAVAALIVLPTLWALGQRRRRR